MATPRRVRPRRRSRLTRAAALLRRGALLCILMPYALLAATLIVACVITRELALGAWRLAQVVLPESSVQ